MTELGNQGHPTLIGLGAVMLKQIALCQARQSYALATVIETKGSVSAKLGAKAVIDAEGKILAGWVGGGCAESTTAVTGQEVITDRLAQIIEIDMNDEVLGVGMPCGGRMKVFIEPVVPAPRVWIMGHGRVAEALCEMASLLGFSVVVNDPLATFEQFPAAEQCLNRDLGYQSLLPLAEDFVVIATQNKGDHQSIDKALDSEAKYIALIASQKRAGLIIDYLNEKQLKPADMDRIYTPCGLHLGACTPEEIALEIVSEIVKLRRSGTGKPKCLGTDETKISLA